MPSPSSPPSFALLYLRPEIASGFYNYPGSNASAPATSVFPGVAPEEAAFLLPDGSLVQQIQQRIRLEGFIVAEQRIVQFTKPQVRRLFPSELDAREEGESRQKYLSGFTRGPSLALLLTVPPSKQESAAPDHAVSMLHALVGPSDPHEARQQALAKVLTADKWPLRALCGLDTDLNGVHASASLDAAYRERFELFQQSTQPELSAGNLQRAVLVLLPHFLTSVPDGRAQLLARLHRHGVMVVSETEKSSWTPDERMALALAELPPSGHSDRDDNHTLRAEFLQQLDVATQSGPSVVLRTEGMHAAILVRRLVGPVSLPQARLEFPDSLRAALPVTCPAFDAVRSRENPATCLDSGLFVAFHDMGDHVGDALAPALDTRVGRTLALIKPNATGDPGSVRLIQDTVLAYGFAIEAQRRVVLSRADAAVFYGEHVGKPFFENLVAFMTSGPIVAMQLSRCRAIATWRALMGPTNSSVARRSHPWTLRARLGLDGTRNATHGSDAPASAHRELRFFFGSRAGSPDQPVASRSVKALAQRTLPLPWPAASRETLEQVLARGLRELLLARSTWSDPLQACQWLGQWLVAHSDSDGFGARSCREVDDEDPERRTHSGVSSTLVRRKLPDTRVSGEVVAASLPGHSLIAIAVTDALALDAAQVHSLGDAIRTHVLPLGYLFVDAAVELEQARGDMATVVRVLLKRVQLADKRRVVVFGFALRSPAFCQAWQEQTKRAVTTVVEIDLRDGGGRTSGRPRDCDGNGDVDDGSKAYRFGALVPSLSLTLAHASSPVSASELRPLFASVLDRILVLLDDDLERVLSLDQWRVVAARFGFALLSFQDMLARVLALEQERHGERGGVFTQWQRTGAVLPEAALLTALRQSLDDAQDSARQKLLLHGFPWRVVTSLAAVERALGPIAAVITPGTEGSDTKKKKQVEPVPWMSEGPVVTHGRQLRVPDKTWGSPACVGTVVACVLAPVVTLILAGASEAEVAAVTSSARSQGQLVLDARAGTPEALRQLLLRANAGHERVVVLHFPASPELAERFLRDIVVPRLVILPANPEQPDASDAIVAAFRNHAPDLLCTQLPGTASRQRGLLSHCSVSILVGDVDDLVVDAVQRDCVDAVGWSVLDLRHEPAMVAAGKAGDPAAVAGAVGETIARLDAMLTPRAIVLGAPGQLEFFTGLEAYLGSALVHILVLKQHRVVAPPRQRADLTEDELDDGFDSDDEAELVRQRQATANALPPGLDRVLTHYAPPSGSPPRRSSAQSLAQRQLSTPRLSGPMPSAVQVSVLRFAATAVAGLYARIHQLLQPRVLALVGHSHSFYVQAATLFAQRHQLPLVSLQGLIHASFPQQLAFIRAAVARTPSRTLLVDAFPRANALDPMAAPYVAQQIQQLEASVAALPVLVHCRASVDVLAERRPPEVSRHMLEDAQDALASGTEDLFRSFAGHRTRRVVTVSCERELEDAVQQLGDVLAPWIR